MAYCRPYWVSDYHFARALRYRVGIEADSGAAAATTGPVRSLLVWGGIDAEGEPFLEPALAIDAPPVLPHGGGSDYRLAGGTAEGRQLFSLSFDMPEVEDGDGSSGFAFALPVEPGWADSLARVTLSGPGGSVTLDGDGDRPVAILRDSGSGQVRAVLPRSAGGNAYPGRHGGGPPASSGTRGEVQPRYSGCRRVAAIGSARVLGSPATSGSLTAPGRSRKCSTSLPPSGRSASCRCSSSVRPELTTSGAAPSRHRSRATRTLSSMPEECVVAMEARSSTHSWGPQ